MSGSQANPGLPLAITCGDPAGVGPEVIADWARHYAGDRKDFVLLGSAAWLKELDGLGYGAFPVGRDGYRAKPGEPDTEGSILAHHALAEAARGCMQGNYSGVVTGPVSKEHMRLAGFEYPGQTEFFARQWSGSPSMCFVGRELKVVLATWHLPLHDVFHELSPVLLIRAVTRAERLARAYGAESPRIGVCGLNPHAGEKGLLGAEEQEWIDPLLDDLREKFPGLSPALPADTVFWRARHGEFDVVVALYHDQGLIAVKTLEFDQAVNLTLGLPCVRTSPDHGTGFDIAGHGKAGSSSFTHAVEVAQRFAKHMSK